MVLHGQDGLLVFASRVPEPTTGSIRTFDAQATVERDMESQCTKQSEEFSLANFKKLPPHKAELRQKKGSKRGPL